MNQLASRSLGHATLCYTHLSMPQPISASATVYSPVRPYSAISACPTAAREDSSRRSVKAPPCSTYGIHRKVSHTELRTPSLVAREMEKVCTLAKTYSHGLFQRHTVCPSVLTCLDKASFSA